MKIGKYLVDSIDAGIFALDGGSMFGVVPKTLWSKAYNSGDDKNRIPLAARPLLVRGEGKNILIDTGNGTKYDDKFNNIYSIDRESSSLDAALSVYGITKEQIDIVILTHLHFDHAGGATDIVDGKVIPAFPNANYYIQHEQINWALKPTEKDRASFVPDNYIPLLKEGMVHALEGEEELLPGISVHPVYGHTQGMQMVKISSEGTTLLYPADLCPTAAHIKVPYIMGYDNFPLTAIEEKKYWWKLAHEEEWIIAFEHDAFRQAAKIIHDDKGYAAGETIKLDNQKLTVENA